MHPLAAPALPIFEQLPDPNDKAPATANREGPQKVNKPAQRTEPAAPVNGLHDPLEQYVANGWALVPIPAGEKGPTSRGWNERERCVLPDGWAGNVGLAHAYSSTCAIDIDDLEHAAAWLKERGVDLAELLSAPDAVRISSGRPNRAKLLYRLAEPLRSKKVIEDKTNIIDFRCATAKSTTCQDLLPPSIHPDTGKPYEWQYNDDLCGDWRCLPEIPERLLAVWQALIIPAAEPSRSDRPRAELSELRRLLKHQDANMDREAWVKVLAAIHWETQGSDEGLALACEWSASGADKFKSDEDVETRWRSFKLDTPNPVTAASLRVDEAAELDDFGVIATEQSAADKSVAAPAAIGVIPKAQHLCTDQANAQRIQRVFGKKLMSVDGQFYFWTGTHWERDEGEAHRCAAGLSALVKVEAEQARSQADAAVAALDPQIVAASVEHPIKHALEKTDAGAKLAKLQASADALEAWSTRCEMKATQDAAVGLLRKLLTVERDALDRDAYALNCLNGTINLRTLELRAHNPADRITKLAPIAYDPAAEAPQFVRFVLEIMAGDTHRAAFLQRWFGYCATGDVREQKLVVHIGAGGNGKGTLLNAVQDVIGEYASTAAPGLLASTGASERHPTEIADLCGRRMVTAHESDDAAVLREGFVKQATGGDRLKGRFMRADLFEFVPTHKLQLLTNHKPQIKGQDFGIWRRILLVPYPLKFGTAAEVAEGKAEHLRDDRLPEALKQERAGIFRWLVEGARDWHRDGLNAPDSVLAAGREYQREQDRVAVFVEECCERDEQAWCSFGEVYSSYVDWCRLSGYQALGKLKFVQELERVVPFFRKEERKAGVTGSRKTLRGARGLSCSTAEL